MFVTSLLCSRIRLSFPLCLSPLYYLCDVFLVSFSVCYVTPVFWASIFSSSVLLRQCTIFFKVSFVSLFFVTSVLCFRIRLSLLLFLVRHYAFSSCFHCFIICLLRQSMAY